MNLRILLLSNARPSRTWKFAGRILSEIPDAEICGVIQYPLLQLPRIQRLIAVGNIGKAGSRGYASSRAARWPRQILGGLVHGLLWFVHGCPRAVRVNRTFTVSDLAEGCRELGRPFLLADRIRDENIAQFADRQHPDLLLVLGQTFLSRDLLEVPRLGSAHVVVGSDSGLQEGAELNVEHFSKGSGSPYSLESVRIPSQPRDGRLGSTLKSDLIADDLLVQAAKGLAHGSQMRVSKEIKEWVQRMLSPYLKQLEPESHRSPSRQADSLRQRNRPVWKLCLQSVLFLPWITARNWHRRLRSRYPVLLLAHHLVSDRPHPMGMPTEDFWRRIRLLQRHYRIVSLSEADRLLRSGRVNAPTVVLTLDDGYRDNFITLRAVAEEAGAKIVLFVATQPMELGQEFDHDRAAGIRGFFPLTWDQARYWSLQGVEFGGHTRTHFDCGSCDTSRLDLEIVGCKRDIEGHLGRPARFFAFPFGKRANISTDAMRMAASNYSAALSSFGGENLPRAGASHRHLLRKGFCFDPWELELEMQSVFDLVQSSRSKAKRLLNSRRLGHVTQAITLWPWRVLFAFLVVLARLPHFRRLLGQIFSER